MKICIIIFFICYSQYSLGHKKEAENKNSTKSELKSAVEIDAIFPGGMELFSKYVKNNLILPEMEGNLHGVIVMSYTVGIDGFLTEIKVVKNTLGSLGENIAIDAVRVLKSSPKWIPASNNGKPIKISNLIPLTISHSE